LFALKVIFERLSDFIETSSLDADFVVGSDQPCTLSAFKHVGDNRQVGYNRLFCGFNRCGRPRITFSALRTIFSRGLCHCGYYRITFSSRTIYLVVGIQTEGASFRKPYLMSPQVVVVLDSSCNGKAADMLLQGALGDVSSETGGVSFLDQGAH